MNSLFLMPLYKKAIVLWAASPEAINVFDPAALLRSGLPADVQAHGEPLKEVAVPSADPDFLAGEADYFEERGLGASCEECGAFILAASEGGLANHHHADSCSLYITIEDV